MNETEKQAAGGKSEYRSQLGQGAFNSSQSSQLFINCCFALSFSGVFFILGQALETSSLYLAWLPLTVYLIFIVWRQYRIYCIPVQYYRPEPESDIEEFVTLFITLMLAGFCLVCVHSPFLALVFLAGLIGLNFIKLKQIEYVLLKAPNQPLVAINHLGVFSAHLIVYLVILFIMASLIWAFHSYLGGDRNFVIIVAISPLVVYFIAQLVQADLYGTRKKPTISPQAYIESVAAAWPRKTNIL